MRPLRLATALLIPLAIGLQLSCTYVTRVHEEEKDACLDMDGDGAPKGNCTNAEYGSYDLPKDCNDNPALQGAMETPGKPEIAYDGLDNDCSFETDGEHDRIDADGDGYPGISRTEWEALGTRHASLWPVNLPSDEASVDCNDDPEDVLAPRMYPKPLAQEVWYDGVDENCDGLDDFDADQDGFAARYCPDPADRTVEIRCDDLYESFAGAGWHRDLPGDDCEDVNPQVNPGFSPEADAYYDGVDKNCDGKNDFDRDGDGYIPTSVVIDGVTVSGLPNLCKAYNIKYKLNVSCNINACRTTSVPCPLVGPCPNLQACDADTCASLTCDALPHPGDCNDDPATQGPPPIGYYNPGVYDLPYDGIDKNCDLADDFDNDRDGYYPSNYASIYPTYAGQPWHKGLVSGECNDINPLVRPGEDEIYGDAEDQDCDGNIDTTPFFFGDFSVRNPLAPVIAANNHHYIVGVAASEWYTGTTSGSSPTDAGYALLFTRNAVGHSVEPARPNLWTLGLTPSKPLAGNFDIVASGDEYTVSFTYNNLGKNWLIVRNYKTTNGGALYGSSLQQTSYDSNEPHKALDLRLSGDGVHWAYACAEGTAQFMAVNFNQTPAIRGSFLKETVGGHACWLDFNGAQGIGSSWTTQNPSGTRSYRLSLAPPGDIVPVAAEWDIPLLNRTTTQGNWYAFAQGHLGLMVSDGVNEYAALTAATTTEERNYHVRSASVVHRNGTIFVLAVVNDLTGDAVPDVVFAHGPPGGELRDVVMPFNHPRFPQEPVHPAIFVDNNALVLAVSGKRRESGNTGAKDSVGWGFVLMP